MVSFQDFIFIDNLSLIVMALVLFLGSCIASFSYRYLAGDQRQKAMYCNLALFLLGVCSMACADHLLLLFASSLLSNFALTNLMLHKKEWEAARQSSRLALSNFLLTALFMGASFWLMYTATGATSIRVIVQKLEHEGDQAWFIPWIIVSLSLSVMTQSGLWPFHRWLTSSLNSPTPVSALMHAGGINSGGLILARFAPILLGQPLALDLLFVVGLATACLGTLWKLMQSDVKRMLACSTMGQMGFMVAQCGLGLFPAAIAHLCYHGLFKAYLFLSSGSAGHEKRLFFDSPIAKLDIPVILLSGFLAAYAFKLAIGEPFLSADTMIFPMFFAALGGIQTSIVVIQHRNSLKWVFALLVGFFVGGIYGLSIHLIENALAPLNISAPQPLNGFHLAALTLFAGGWLFMTYFRRLNLQEYPEWMLRLYVAMLNGSQPDYRTVTVSRNEYKF